LYFPFLLIVFVIIMTCFDYSVTDQVSINTIHRRSQPALNTARILDLQTPLQRLKAKTAVLIQYRFANNISPLGSRALASRQPVKNAHMEAGDYARQNRVS